MIYVPFNNFHISILALILGEFVIWDAHKYIGEHSGSVVE